MSTKLSPRLNSDAVSSVVDGLKGSEMLKKFEHGAFRFTLTGVVLMVILWILLIIVALSLNSAIQSTIKHGVSNSLKQNSKMLWWEWGYFLIALVVLILFLVIAAAVVRGSMKKC